MTDTTEEAPRFTTWFAQHAKGNVDRELATMTAEVTEAVRLIDKKGSITITIEFEPLGDAAIAVTAKAKAKPPEAPEMSVFFLDEDGQMTRNDPGAMFHSGRNAEVANPVLLEDGGVVDAATGEIRSELRVVNDGD